MTAQSFFVRVPASSANLGPGFDALTGAASWTWPGGGARASYSRTHKSPSTRGSPLGGWSRVCDGDVVPSSARPVRPPHEGDPACSAVVEVGAQLVDVVRDHAPWHAQLFCLRLQFLAKQLELSGCVVVPLVLCFARRGLQDLPVALLEILACRFKSVELCNLHKRRVGDIAH